MWTWLWVISVCGEVGDGEDFKGEEAWLSGYLIDESYYNLGEREINISVS